MAVQIYIWILAELTAYGGNSPNLEKLGGIWPSLLL